LLEPLNLFGSIFFRHNPQNKRLTDKYNYFFIAGVETLNKYDFPCIRQQPMAEGYRAEKLQGRAAKPTT